MKVTYRGGPMDGVERELDDSYAGCAGIMIPEFEPQLDFYRDGVIPVHVRDIDGRTYYGTLPTWRSHYYSLDESRSVMVYQSTSSKWDIGCPCDDCERRRKAGD